MKVSDYMVRFLEARGVTDVFGIPGVGCGHFMNSMIGSGITSHLTYHEQGAAFAACAVGQVTRKAGVAYTTAGPGGTNLITGIANAYCDSIPTVFIVGEKDLASLRGGLQVRQRASQEVDIVRIAEPVTKWSYQITRKEEVRQVLEKAFYLAEHGRPGPVLLDIPSDIQRAEVDPDTLEAFSEPEPQMPDGYVGLILSCLASSQRPLFLIGNGVKQLGMERELFTLGQDLNIPVVTTLVCLDMAGDASVNLGYIGMDGDPAANRAVHDCDLLITFGARLNFKQTGDNRTAFAPHAKILRIDCDRGELSYRLRDEIEVCADLRDLIPALVQGASAVKPWDGSWLGQCQQQRAGRKASLNPAGDALMKAICEKFPEDALITVDTGSHRRWLMSQYVGKAGQQVLQSAGLASMGYALPAAIGGCYAKKAPVICVDGDGGIMMNLQELQVIARERLPITVLVFNNHCLGDIMEFQKRIFQGNYFTTTEDSGYQAADFAGIAGAFHLAYQRISAEAELAELDFRGAGPQLIEVLLPSNEK